MLRSLLALLALTLALESAAAYGGEKDSSAVAKTRPQEAELAFLSSDFVAPMPPVATIDVSTVPAYSSLRPISDVLTELTGTIAPQVGRAMAAPVIRGASPRRMTVLFDGVPLGHSALRSGPSFLPLGMVDPAALRSVRIRMGPGPQDLFLGSASSVIHLIPLVDGTDTGQLSGVTAAQQFSSADKGWSGRLTASGTAGQLRYQVGGLGRLLSNLRSGELPAGEAVQPYTGVRESALHAVGAYKMNSRLEVRAGLLSSNRARQSAVGALESPDAGASGASFAIFDPRQITLLYGSARIRNAGSIESVNLTAWLNRQRETRTLRKTVWSMTLFDDDRMTAAGLRVDAVARVSSTNRLRSGVDFATEWVDARRKEVRDNGDVFYQRGRFPGDVRSHTGGVFIEEAWTPSPQFSLEYGARLSVRSIHVGYGPSAFGASGALRDIDRTYGGLSWHVRATQQVDEGWKLSGSVGSGFRPPDLDEVAANADWKQGRDVPNPDVRSESALEAEIGVANVSASGRRLSATVYHTRYVDPIYRSWTDSGPDLVAGTSDDLFRFVNFDAVQISGLEIEAAAFAYQGATQSVRFTANVLLQHVRAPAGVPRFVPPAVMRLGVQYQRQHLTAESYVRTAAGTPAVLYGDGAGEIDGTAGWTTLNLRAAYGLGSSLQFHAALENILDTAYREHGSHLLSPGRNVVAGMSYRF